MKRSALLFMSLALGTASAAEAQLTMQMSNGWNFTFSGNVNAFATYESFKSSGTTITPGGIVPLGGTAENEFRIRTGLLPTFAVLEAKGKEGNLDLGVHFGFAPQINLGSGKHDNFGNGTQAGAQIDMRQVYMTVGGEWGQILAGRELGVFLRQNILTDQTLFGVGATGSAGTPNAPGTGNGAGTTLGRIGFGYIYPNFLAQMTYSTAAGRPLVFTIGVFEASSNGVYNKIELPRLEAEAVWTNAASTNKAWLGGLVQNNKNSVTDDKATAYGGSAGFRLGTEVFALTGSGYYGRGLGTTLMFAGGVCDAITCGTGGTDDLRKSYGFIGQATVTPKDSKLTIAGSYGSSYLKAAPNDPVDFRTDNALISGGLYYQATKALKVVGEFNYAWTTDNVDLTEKNQSFTPAFGLMLFF